MKLFFSLTLSIQLLFCYAQDEMPLLPKQDHNSLKYGLINSNDEWLVTPQFDLLQKLNGYFYYGENKKSGGYIYNYNISAHQLKRINYRLFDNTIYHNQFVIIQEYNNGPKGVMDIYGKEILNTFYTNIWIKENYFIGELNNKVYLYNQKGEKVFPKAFTYITIKNGLIYVKTEDNRFLNKERFIVYNSDLQPIIKETWTANGQFGKDHLLWIKTTDEQTFYIDETGKIRINSNSKFNFESPFSNGFAIISSKDNPKKYGFIDTQGKIIIPMEYKEVAPFQEYYAYFSKEENGKLIEGLIDKKNKPVKIFPAKVTSKSIYYDSNEATYYLSNLETYDANGNFQEDKNPIR